MAYLDGDIPYDDRLMELFNAVDTMETIGYHPNNVKYINIWTVGTMVIAW